MSGCKRYFCTPSFLRLFFSAVTLGILIFSTRASAEHATIAVASNFTSTLRSLSQRFERRCDCDISIVSGSSGKLYFQITQGAPFDAFFSADESMPLRLVEEGFAMADSYFIYASGVLSLFGEADLGNANKIAIANPKLAPYGRAAIEYIDSLDNAAEIKGKLVLAENVSQAFQFVWAGAAQSAFAPLAFSVNDPADKTFSKKKGVTALLTKQVPLTRYSPIRQGAVITKDTQTVRNFFSYVASPEAQAFIKAAGYEVGLNVK